MSDQRPIGSFANQVKRINETCISGADVYSVTKYDGFVRSLDYFKKQVFSRDLSSYKIVKRGEFAYSTIHLDEGALGLLGDEEALISPMYTTFEVDESVDKIYLSYLLRSPELVSQYGLIGQGSVNRRKSVPFSSLAEIEVFTPPLPEQKKIAKILSGIDAIVQKQKRKAIALGHLQASLIKDITLGTKEEGSRQATDIGECPADWKATKLGDIAEFTNGNSFKSEDWQENGYPIIRIQNLNGGSDFNYFSGMIDEKWFVPRGSLLFAWSGQRGKSFGPFIWNGQDGVLNQHIFKVTHAQDIDRDFLFLLLKMAQLKAERDAHGFKDSFMHVKKSDIVSTSIAIPPVEAQKRLADSYKQVSLQISLEEKKMESLKNLKYSISAYLLSGRKRVSV